MKASEVLKKSGEPVDWPNPVGERLTEPPEVGTPVVEFQDKGCWFAYVWGLNSCWFTRICLYRWLGPIPEEPKPEKVEPPKWLGAVRDGVGSAAWVSRIGPPVYIVYQDGSCGKVMAFEDLALAPDIMPPSPELAALFGESEVKQ